VVQLVNAIKNTSEMIRTPALNCSDMASSVANSFLEKPLGPDLSVAEPHPPRVPECPTADFRENGRDIDPDFETSPTDSWRAWPARDPAVVEVADLYWAFPPGHGDASAF
jgi:hypothetical protein